MSSRTPRPSARPGPSARPEGDRARLVGLRDRVSRLIEPVIGQVGFDLERVGVSRVGRRYRVEVVVDRDEGVGLDAVADVSRAVSAALDTADHTGEVVIPGEYVLEVGSPGVDRPLVEPRHWRRSRGRLVTVPVTSQGQTRRITGRVVTADDAGVTLEVEGTRRTVIYGELGTGRVQVELRRLDEVETEPDQAAAGQPSREGRA